MAGQPRRASTPRNGTSTWSPATGRGGERTAFGSPRECWGSPARRTLGIGIRRLRACGGPPDDDYADLMRRAAWWQRGLTESGFEVKAWSRHALVACALEACALPVTAAVVEAAAGWYWTTVAARAVFYPDAMEFVRRLRDAGVAIRLAIGSDGFLTFEDARAPCAVSQPPQDKRSTSQKRSSSATASPTTSCRYWSSGPHAESGSFVMARPR
jgi:hypothetical protein